MKSTSNSFFKKIFSGFSNSSKKIPSIPVSSYEITQKEKLAQSLLEKAYVLANTLNTTIDRQEFFMSFDELNEVLYSLKNLEGTIKFSGKLPSEQIEEINKNKALSISLLEQRIQKAILSEAFAKSSNKGSSSTAVASSKIKLKVDPSFIDVGELITRKQRATVGMIQRSLKIGFNRANRIMEQLFEAGVVGPENGTKPREVLMSFEEFENFIINTEIIDYTLPSHNDNITLPDSTLSERIQMYNEKYDYMEGHDFEYFCADLLRKNGYVNINVTQNSNDQGIDIIAEKSGVKYGIQCKCYSSDIGNRAVQEAFSGAHYYDCHVPVVMTNRYFTQQAQKLAKKNNVLLWDRDILNMYIKASH